MCTVRHSLFTASLGDTGRPCSVSLSLLEHRLYIFVYIDVIRSKRLPENVSLSLNVSSGNSWQIKMTTDNRLTNKRS